MSNAGRNSTQHRENRNAVGKFKKIIKWASGVIAAIIFTWTLNLTFGFPLDKVYDIYFGGFVLSQPSLIESLQDGVVEPKETIMDDSGIEFDQSKNIRKHMFTIYMQNKYKRTPVTISGATVTWYVMSFDKGKDGSVSYKLIERISEDYTLNGVNSKLFKSKLMPSANGLALEFKAEDLEFSKYTKPGMVKTGVLLTPVLNIRINGSYAVVFLGSYKPAEFIISKADFDIFEETMRKLEFERVDAELGSILDKTKVSLIGATVPMNKVLFVEKKTYGPVVQMIMRSR